MKNTLIVKEKVNERLLEKIERANSRRIRPLEACFESRTRSASVFQRKYSNCRHSKAMPR